MRDLPQQDHADLGIVDDDATDDLRPKKTTTPKAATPRPSEPTHHPIDQGDPMTTITPDTNPPVPPGAEPDQWVGGQRDVYAQVGYVAVSPDLLKCPAVTLVAEQHADGHLGRTDIMLDVAMGRSDAGLSSGQARELAGLLVAGADLADSWSGQPVGAATALDTAHAALDSACRALRRAPGNAGSWAKAALDAVTEARAVLR